MSPKRAAVESIKQIVNYIVKSNSFDNVTRTLKITDGGSGHCSAEFIVTLEHLNYNGHLHPGLTATILDNITTYALMSASCHPGVSVNMQLSYFVPAKEGDEIIVEAKTVNAGKKLAHLVCELRKKNDGTIIAKGAQTKFVDFN